MIPQPWNESVARANFQSYLRYQKDFDGVLRGILEDAASEAGRLIGRLPKTTTSEKLRVGQFNQYQQGINQILDQTWNGTLDEILGRIRGASGLAISGNDEMIARLLLGRSSQLMLEFQQAAQRAALNVQSRLMNQINLSARVYKNKALSSGMVDKAINRGIALGKSAREIANDVRKLISTRTPGGVSYAAKRLGRTEINNAFHTTQTRIYEGQPWVSGVKWVVSGSHPRPDVCDEYAKQDHDDLGPGVFKKGNVPGKPHPQCLCHIVAITIPREEFLDNLLAGKYNRFINR